MKTEIKIIKFLLVNRKRCTIRETAKHIKADYKITHTAVQNLIKKGVLDSKKVGQSSQISLTRKITREVYEAEDDRRKELLKNKDIQTIAFWLSELNFPFIAIVFGSHAKGTATKQSDIDLLVICDESRRGTVENKLSMTLSNVHVVTLTPDEFSGGLRISGPTVQAESLENHVILVNIEQYYGMINNVG